MADLDHSHSLPGHDWVYFCSKPFSLFTISLWDHCYSEYMGLITRSLPALRDSVFIQGKDDIVRNYRRKKDLENIKKIMLETYMTDRAFLLQRLGDARDAYDEGVLMLDDNSKISPANLQKALDLTCRIAVLGSVLPRFLSQALVEAKIFDNEILDKCIELKKVSLYPRILAERIEPFVMDRNQLKIDGKYFIYIANNSMVDIFWTKEPEQYAKAIEDMGNVSKIEASGTLKCQPVFPGKAKGIARVCLSMDGADIGEFSQGDILVTTDSNPNLRHLIEKAGGLIVEEGGMFADEISDDSAMIIFEKNITSASHASVLSQEYGIPCVMNVRNATSVIKTGDTIEIDASAGTVKILSRTI